MSQVKVVAQVPTDVIVEVPSTLSPKDQRWFAYTRTMALVEGQGNRDEEEQLRYWYQVYREEHKGKASEKVWRNAKCTVYNSCLVDRIRRLPNRK